MSVYFGNKKVSPLIVQSKQQTNTEVQLALTGGNQDVIAPTGYLYYKVTIIKPDTLVSNNIRKGVTIAGVIGTMEEQKEEEEKTINITANNTYAVVPTEGKTLSKVTAVVTVSPTLQSKSVTPSTTQQIVTSDDGYQGLSQVIVYKAPTETIEITPTKEVQTKQPSGDAVGYSEVTVKPIPDNYIIPSGTLEITGNGTYDVYGKASAVVNVPTSSGAELNIHYGDTTPEDTSKLWIMSPKPASIEFAKKPEQSKGINTLATKLPMAAENIAAAAVGTKIYLFGGHVGYKNSLNTIQEFDTETETITTLSATLPKVMFNIACAAAGTKIYLFGGYDGNGNYLTAYLNTIQEFDTETKTISTLSVTLPNGASNMAAAAVGTKIYVFGGHGSDTSMFNTILEFDTETKTISTLSVTLPTVLYSMPAVAVGTKIYLFGGTNNKSGIEQLDTILEFDTETKTVSTLPATLPAVLYLMPAAAVGTKIYIFGGCRVQSVNTILEFDTETKNISTLSITLPTQSDGMPAAAVGTKIYIFGGNGPSGTKLNTILEFIDFVLASGNVFVQEDFDNNVFTLVPAPTKVKIGVKNVYKGNSNNVAEFVDAYLYDGTKWVNINTGVPLGLLTPSISFVSGTTIQIDTIDDNATTIEVFADGVSIGEVQKQ